MLEVIAAVISGCAFTLGVVKFIVSRYDKKLEKREEDAEKQQKVIDEMKQEIKSLRDTTKDQENKIDNLEKGSARFEISIDRQMRNLDDKLEKIYTFLLQQKVNQ